jgi:hypothetical protein
MRERVLIIFKSKDKEEAGCLSPVETLSILKENFPKVILFFVYHFLA